MLQHRIYDKSNLWMISEEIREQIKQKSSIPVIPRKKNSKTGNVDIDWGLYKYRHLVENIFARLKQFRSIALL
jgi:transposase